MARRYLQTYVFKCEYNISSLEATTNYCKNLFLRKRLLQFSKDNSEDVTYVGKSSLRKIGDVDCLVYKKCIYKKKGLSQRTIHSGKKNR